MTTINFPSAPALDQVYTLGDKSWAWNGTGWVAVHEPRALDTELRDRATHTGEQATSTITGLDMQLAGKQASLVSGANIKTINGAPITGAGNIAVGDVTLAGVQTLANKTLTGYTETVYNLTGTDIAVANGTIQTKTLAANTTFTESLADGQSVILGITAGAYSITWPSVTWAKVGGSGVAPTLTSTGANWVVLWKVNGTVHGSFMGTT